MWCEQVRQIAGQAEVLQKYKHSKQTQISIEQQKVAFCIPAGSVNPNLIMTVCSLCLTQSQQPAVVLKITVAAACAAHPEPDML